MELNHLREFVSQVVNGLSPPTLPRGDSQTLSPNRVNSDRVMTHNLTQLDALLQQLAATTSHSPAVEHDPTPPPRPLTSTTPPSFDHTQIINQILHLTNQIQNIASEHSQSIGDNSSENILSQQPTHTCSSSDILHMLPRPPQQTGGNSQIAGASKKYPS